MRSGARSSVIDIAERLRLYARHFEDLHAPQNVTIGMREAADEIERLRAALKDARVSLEGWADYASDYIKEKWDLKGDLARIDAALEGK